MCICAVPDFILLGLGRSVFVVKNLALVKITYIENKISLVLLKGSPHGAKQAFYMNKNVSYHVFTLATKSKIQKI